jgi:hypothetical protein
MRRSRRRSGDEKLAFAILEPRSVVVEGGNQSVEHELTCGPQKPRKVSLQYEMKLDAKLGTQGVVRVLEFR